MDYKKEVERINKEIPRDTDLGKYVNGLFRYALLALKEEKEDYEIRKSCLHQNI